MTAGAADLLPDDQDMPAAVCTKELAQCVSLPQSEEVSCRYVVVTVQILTVGVASPPEHSVRICQGIKETAGWKCMVPWHVKWEWHLPTLS